MVIKHGKHGTVFLMISNNMGKHDEHKNLFFMSSGKIRKPWEARDSCAAVFT